MTKDTGAARIAELEADNLRLRRLLDQRDVPAELRHRLRNMVALLRTIIRGSSRRSRDVDLYAAHLEDRLVALARAQGAADSLGRVDLHSTLAHELLYYGASEGKRLELSGPAVEFQPRAGQVFALAVHELAVNAVEHGALSRATGRIAVSWDVAPGGRDPALTFSWKETGADGLGEPVEPGFGTEVLTRKLAYELDAQTSLAFEPDGLRCTIFLLMPDAVARVAQS